MLTSLTVDQIDTVTVYYQFSERSAYLSQTDVEQLIPLLQNISLRGRSVRLTVAEKNPYYSVRLKNGKIFTVMWFDGYYIVDGRGYLVNEGQQSNYEAIDSLYQTHLDNREYFPRNDRG